MTGLSSPRLRAALALLLCACATDNEADRVLLSHIDQEVAPADPFRIVYSEAFVLDTTADVTVGQKLSDFVANLATHAQPGDRVGTFPLVSYGLRRDGPWVSELGFGTVKRENNQPVNGRDILSFDLNAMRVSDAQLLARSQFQVLSDRKENMATFDLAERDSLWLADGN